MQNESYRGKKGKKELIAGYTWKPVTLNNVMMYFCILMYTMLFPVTGHRMREAWDLSKCMDEIYE